MGKKIFIIKKSTFEIGISSNLILNVKKTVFNYFILRYKILITQNSFCFIKFIQYINRSTISFRASLIDNTDDYYKLYYKYQVIIVYLTEKLYFFFSYAIFIFHNLNSKTSH